MAVVMVVAVVSVVVVRVVAVTRETFLRRRSPMPHHLKRRLLGSLVIAASLDGVATGARPEPERVRATVYACNCVRVAVCV